jgi:hypothetical protein
MPGTAYGANEVTAQRGAHSIWYVASPGTRVLTRRRAVDFCRVAAALC